MRYCVTPLHMQVSSSSYASILLLICKYPPPHMQVSSSSYAIMLLLICNYASPHMQVSSSSYASILLLICKYPPPHMQVCSSSKISFAPVPGPRRVSPAFAIHSKRLIALSIESFFFIPCKRICSVLFEGGASFPWAVGEMIILSPPVGAPT
jgi:hypothetical protein